MKQNRSGWIIGGVVVIIIVVVAVIIGTQSGKKGSDMTGMDMSGMNMSNQSTDAGTAVATNKVTIGNYSFSPTPIKVKVGTTVTWTNTDSVHHTVTSDDGAPASFNSGDIGKGQTFSFTFTKAGTYTYHCEPHPFMHGTVVVTN